MALGGLQTEGGGKGMCQSVTQAGTNSQTVERREEVPGDLESGPGAAVGSPAAPWRAGLRAGRLGLLLGSARLPRACPLQSPRWALGGVPLRWCGVLAGVSWRPLWLWAFVSTYGCLSCVISQSGGSSWMSLTPVLSEKASRRGLWFHGAPLLHDAPVDGHCSTPRRIPSSRPR